MEGTDPRRFGEAEEPGDDDGTEARPAPRLFDIAPGTPFLRELVRSLCDGRLIPGFRDGADDPLALASATIYVPTRRAARELRSVFVAELSAGGTGRAALLPSIRALGDVDDDEGFFEEAVPELLSLAPVIGSTERTVALAQLVLAWIRSLPEALEGLHGGEGIEVPSSPADAVWLAQDLAKLMDEMERQGTDWRELIEIDTGEHAIWWQLTTQFLAIVTDAWPAYLKERDRSNPADHDNAAIRAVAARLRRKGSAGPVIVAVSPLLGPATIELVDAVSRLPNGAVILPGLDKHLDDAEFAGIGTPGGEGIGEDARAPGHPQFGHGRLLAALRASRDDVARLGEPEPGGALREAVVCEAMRPAETTHRWVETVADLHRDGGLPEAFAEVEIVEAPGPREEALAIAAKLREAIEEPGRTAALVTPDRLLARRVAAELRRFGIEADDSAGIPLRDTPAGAFMRLALAAALEPGDPHALLGLLKHPLARFGLSRSVVRRATHVIELVALRTGAPGPVDPAGLSDLFETKLAAIDADGGRKPFWRPRFDEVAIAEARELIDRVRSAPLLLSEARERGDVHPPSVWAGYIGALLDIAGEDEDGGFDAIYATPDGAALARSLRELMAVEDESFPVAAHELTATVEALLSAVSVRRPASGHPRVSILGLIESRLLSPDTVVLGGLNEGTWPTEAKTDQFLSRPMREVLSLEPPERRIGLEAHDLTMMLGARRVVLTRALRDGDKPSTASRWLQRLAAVLDVRRGDGPTPWETICERGRATLAHVAVLDEAPSTERLRQPEPRPPVSARPTTLSVTEIETLRRDPYAVYARRVLRLEPIDPPRGEPDARERGTLFHAIVERFVRNGQDPKAPEAMEVLYAVARDCFDEVALPPEVDRIWWTRFSGMAEAYLEWEAARADEVRETFVEQWATAEIDGTTLRGIADRVDVMRDGRIEIIDYKTGTVPSKKQVQQLLSPQLPLEAALAARGGFGRLGKREASSLVHVHLKPGTGSDGKPKFKGEKAEKDDDVRLTAHALGERAWAQLRALLAHYRDPASPYPSRVMPFREGDMGGTYDHLARVREWATGEGEDGEGGPGDGGPS